MHLNKQQMDAVVRHIRLAVKANAESWDHRRDAERVAGQELDLAQLVDDLSVLVDDPDDAMTLSEKDIVPEIVRQLLNSPADTMDD